MALVHFQTSSLAKGDNPVFPYSLEQRNRVDRHPCLAKIIFRLPVYYSTLEVGLCVKIQENIQILKMKYSEFSCVNNSMQLKKLRACRFAHIEIFHLSFSFIFPVIDYWYPSFFLQRSKDRGSSRSAYSGVQCKAYLPNSAEGREVLRLLKRAFEENLVFRVSSRGTVEWCISHKTTLQGSRYKSN